MKTLTLDNGQYISDVNIDTSLQYILVVAPTGTGKTRWAIENFDNFDMVFPTRINGLQKASQYNLHFVQEGVSVNDDAKQLGTFDAISKFTGRDCSERTLIIDESHHHILSANENYRKDVIEKLISSFVKYKQVILLTGTKIETTHPAFDHFVQYTVIQKYAPDINYSCVRATEILPTIEYYLVPNHVNVILCNDKKRIDRYANFFTQCGKRVGIITSDTIDEELGQRIIHEGEIDASYDIIFLTSVLTESIDIYHCHLGSIQIITRDNPATIRQLISRFRDTVAQGVYVYISWEQDSGLYFDRKSEEEWLREKALKKLDLFNNLLEDDMIAKEGIVNSIRHDLQSEFSHMYILKNNKYIVDETGISYYVYNIYIQKMYKNSVMLIQELKKYNMTCLDIRTCDRKLSDTGKKVYEEIQEKQRQQRQETFTTNLKACQNVDKEALETLSHTNSCAKKIHTLLSEYHISQDAAYILVKEYGTSTQKYHQLLRQLRIQKYHRIQGKDIEGTIDAICSSFVIEERYLPSQIFANLSKVFSDSSYYDTLGYQLTETKAIRTLKDFFYVKRCKIKDTSGKFSANGYQIVSNNPFEKLLGKTPLWEELS